MDAHVSGGAFVHGGTVAVTAFDDTLILAVTGRVTVNTGNGASFGASITLNEVGSPVRAYVDHASVTASTSATISAAQQ